MREAGIAVRAFLDFAREKIVGLTRVAVAVATSRSICTPGPAMAQHGARDAGLVHRLQPLLAEIGQPRQQIAAACFGSTLPTVVRQ